jgi:hypothetical protein
LNQGGNPLESLLGKLSCALIKSLVQ